MTRTVICTFEQPDFADFALGRLRAEIPGVISVRSLRKRSPHSSEARMLAAAPSAWAPADHRALTLKIVCETACADRVAALVRNMHGYGVSVR